MLPYFPELSFYASTTQRAIIRFDLLDRRELWLPQQKVEEGYHLIEFQELLAKWPKNHNPEPTNVSISVICLGQLEVKTTGPSLVINTSSSIRIPIPEYFSGISTSSLHEAK